MDIGRLFSTSFAMFRQRFWPLAGMWAVFFAIQIGAMIVLGIAAAVLGISGLATDLEDPAAIAGMGVGMILLLVLFYGAYIVVILAQQAALVTLASPLEEPAFGAALSRGFRSALPFLGITLIMVLVYFVLVLVLGGVAGLAAAGGGAAGSILVALLAVPAIIYLGCRFAVLVPVVAVDQVFNPLTAIRRSWAVTQGKVLAIFLAIVGFLLASLVALGLPFGLMVYLLGGTGGGSADPGAAFGMVALGFLVFVPLFIAYSIYAAAFTASMHSEVTGGGAESLEEVFA